LLSNMPNARGYLQEGQLGNNFEEGIWELKSLLTIEPF
jgi:hypothetical protein